MQRKALLGSLVGIGALYALGSLGGKAARSATLSTIAGALPQARNPFLSAAQQRLTEVLTDALVDDPADDDLDDGDPGEPSLPPVSRIKRRKPAGEVTVINGAPVRIRDAEFTPIKQARKNA